MGNLPAYRKTITAVITGLLGWGTLVISSPAVAIMGAEWLTLGIVLATALGVYTVPNEEMK